MFEKLKEVCNYKRDGNCCYGYVCAYDENNPDLCSEEHCPFMDVINRPHKFDAKVALDACNERAKEQKQDECIIKLNPPDGPEADNYDVVDLANGHLENISHTVNVISGKHTDDVLMMAFKKIADGHFVENFVVDEEKVVDAFGKYQKKKVTKVYYKTANGTMSSRCCPTCNKTLLGAVEENYCLHCGQHLDWEVEK